MDSMQDVVLAGMSSRQDLSSQVESLTLQVEQLSKQLIEVTGDKNNAGAIDVIFTLTCGIFIVMMQNGFAMLEAGAVRTKNVKNVLLKNICDACVGTLAFYITGWAFAAGEPSNSVIGYGNFALASSDSNTFNLFFFQWTFCATAATIVSGSVAERTAFNAYLAYTVLMSALVFPVASHWVWGSNGWLSAFADEPLFGVGVVDFAGDVVVHVLGGWAGLIGAVFVGPRIGRFDDDGTVNPIPGHSSTLFVLGAFLLWTGWYGFNIGSTTGSVNLIGEMARPVQTMQRVAVNTTLSSAAASITALLYVKIRLGFFDLVSCLNGLLAGLVAITSGCGSMNPYAAFVTGIVGAFTYLGGSWLLLFLRIDDPLDAFPVHGCVGIWGMIATAFFATQPNQIDAGYSGEHFGLFYGGGAMLLAANLIAVLTVIAWTCFTISPLFLMLNVLGILKIPREEELRGNDVARHGGAAYVVADGNKGRRTQGPDDSEDEGDPDRNADWTACGDDQGEEPKISPSHEDALKAIEQGGHLDN